MLIKERAIRKRTCKDCGGEIKPGKVCFSTTSSGHYPHTICKGCVMKEVRRKI